MLNTANVIQILNAGIIPLISILIFNKSLSHILYSMGILWIISSAPHSIIILNKSIQITKKKYVFIKSIKTLFSYGFPRVIGEFAMFGFFSIPVIYSAHKVNLEYSGFLSLSFSFFQLFATSYSFIGILMLPTVSRNLLDDKFLTIKKRIDLILLISIFINVLYIIFSFLFLEKIILLFFGSEYLESNMITLKLLYGLIPYIVFFLLRDVLDAISEFPSNSINLSLSLFVMIGLLFLDIFSVENTMLICFCLLGLLSLYSYRRHVKIILLKIKQFKIQIMNALESLVYNILKSNPEFKRKIRNIYQDTLDILYNGKNESSYNIEVREGFYFGFHDKSPWSPDNTLLLSNQILPPGRSQVCPLF